MLQKLNGRLVFTYSGPEKKYKEYTKAKYKLSLLGLLMGIFLLPQVAYLSSIAPEKLIELTNKERQTAGLNSLTANQLLTQAAIEKGKTIIETNIFSHTINDKRFSAWVRDAGYNYSYVGENLAIDFSSSEGVIEAWNNSPLHKKNLLNPYYREIGISAVSGKFQGQETTVVVQVFGAPAAGAIDAWPINPGSGYLNPNSQASEINSSNFLFSGQRENLLTRSIINRELLPVNGDKLALNDYSQSGSLNKFIVQPDFRAGLNNFLMIFSSLTLVCLIIFLFYYYFLKINKLISAQS